MEENDKYEKERLEKGKRVSRMCCWEEDGYIFKQTHKLYRTDN
jgi:hypothetical protein